MKNPALLSTLVALAISLPGCSRVNDAPAAPLPSPAIAPATNAPASPSMSTPPVSLDADPTSATLPMLAKHHLADIGSITFGGVVDSRCPAKVQCVWAGEAFGLFLVSALGQADVTLALPLHDLADTAAAQGRRTAAGYRFRLLSLEPGPIAGEQVANERYVAQLMIEPDAEASEGDPVTDIDPGKAAESAPSKVVTPHPVPDPEIPGLATWSRHDIGMHESAPLSDTSTLTLAGVIESRCPEGYACATAGEAEVLFLVRSAGRPAEGASLQWGAKAWHDPELRYKKIAGHRVLLDAIEPRPYMDDALPAAKYRATLLIDPLP